MRLSPRWWWLTSCSDRGIFLSFILCTPAEAEPSSEPAASSKAVFIVKMLQKLTMMNYSDDDGWECRHDDLIKEVGWWRRYGERWWLGELLRPPLRHAPLPSPGTSDMSAPRNPFKNPFNYLDNRFRLHATTLSILPSYWHFKIAGSNPRSLMLFINGLRTN